MPENAQFQPHANLLSPQEIEGICQTLFLFGVDEIRVTGGEPTLRPEFDAIIAKLAGVPWKKFGITTNGILLNEKLPLLWDLGCIHLNISLDSLNPETFARITRRNLFGKVIASIRRARAMGFSVKVNAVIMRGFNDGELGGFLAFAEDEGVEVRFLEMMRVGPAVADHAERFVAAEEMIASLLELTSMEREETSIDATAFVYKTGKGGRLGFIASESQPFCGACSRLRLTALGKLRACLFSEAGLDLRGRDPLDYPEILAAVMAMKPAGRLPRILQPMNEIGG